jgi:hypothetical protein
MKKQNNKRNIIIHYLPSHCDPHVNSYYYIEDITISIYYLSENMHEWSSIPDENRKEGYIVKVDLKELINLKIENISEEFFDKVYEELDNIDFESFANEGFIGGFYDDDGQGLEIEIGIVGDINVYSKKLKLLVPFNKSKDDNGSELSKLLRTINDLKNQINFDTWYDKISDKWGEWKRHLNDFYYIFKDIK